MPLFLDLHKASDFEKKPTVDDIKNAHIADLAIQSNYGVRFIQYWINEEDGLVFCMMEAPDKEACAAVHAAAHGNMPCNVIELKGGDYQTFMGDQNANEFDIVENPNGSLDTGCRILLAVEFLTASEVIPLNRKIKEVVLSFQGREVNHAGERIIAVFNSGDDAINCASEILNGFTADATTEVQIGIHAGDPLTEKDNFFEAVLQFTNRLCDIAANRQAVISSKVKNMATHSFNENCMRSITQPDEKLLNRLLDTVEPTIDSTGFNIEDIGKNIGLSRAQAYRKITSLTGRSPNNFVKELRLKKAFRLIKREYGNISEVAYESGFSNPSYFSTVFQKRFGVLPSHYLNIRSN